MPFEAEQHRDTYIRYTTPESSAEFEGGDVYGTIKITDLHTVEETKQLIETVSMFTASLGPVKEVNIDGYGVVFAHWHKEHPRPPATEGWERYYQQPLRP